MISVRRAPEAFQCLSPLPIKTVHTVLHTEVEMVGELSNFRKKLSTAQIFCIGQGRLQKLFAPFAALRTYPTYFLVVTERGPPQPRVSCETDFFSFGSNRNKPKHWQFWFCFGIFRKNIITSFGLFRLVSVCFGISKPFRNEPKLQKLK